MEYCHRQYFTLTLTDEISVDVLDNKYQIEQLLGQGGSDQFEALDIPRSKWQARMKSGWTKAQSTDYTDRPV